MAFFGKRGRIPGVYAGAARARTRSTAKALRVVEGIQLVDQPLGLSTQHKA
jgi:hypothetical protein